MIGRIRGVVIERAVTRLVVDVHGVGYLVNVTAQCPFGQGAEVDLHIHTHVRDDAIVLFGFADPLEREIFDLLISVPGIGPVKAMGILQTPAATFVELVLRREPARLAKLPGVGKKTAERILLDLGEKLTSLAPRVGTAGMAAGISTGGGVAKDLMSALVNLGFREGAAELAAAGALERLGDSAPLEDLLREALAQKP